jgi:hypothetical protein
MHMGQFSRVRDFIVGKTEFIVQDDSGIPVRFFPDRQWERSFFGAYDGPIQLFANRYQQDLQQAYATSARPLDFGIGYEFQAKASNIQRFIRKRGMIADDRIAGVATQPLR